LIQFGASNRARRSGSHEKTLQHQPHTARLTDAIDDEQNGARYLQEVAAVIEVWACIAEFRLGERHPRSGHGDSQLRGAAVVGI
jgi:hypothetical protein